MIGLGLNILYGLFWMVTFIAIVPTLIVLEQRYFSDRFHIPGQETHLIRSYRQFFTTSRSNLWGDWLSLPFSIQIFNLVETAFLLALWLILPYQMQILDDFPVWLLLVIVAFLFNIINSISAAEDLDTEIGTAGILKNGISLLSSFIPVLITVLIVISSDRYENFADLSLKQGGFWLGFIPRWNIFRSPFHFLTAISYIVNLVILMRMNDKGFQPFEFQEPSEIYNGRHAKFGSFLQFNRTALLFTLSALMVFLFLGGWPQASDWEIRRLASLPGGVWFLCKSILVFGMCSIIKYRLPLLGVRQILNFNLKIQVPVLILVWLGALVVRWL